MICGDALHSRRGEDPPRDKGRDFFVATACGDEFVRAHVDDDAKDADGDCYSSFNSILYSLEWFGGFLFLALCYHLYNLFIIELDTPSLWTLPVYRLCIGLVDVSTSGELRDCHLHVY